VSTPEFVHPVPRDDARNFLRTLATTFLENPYEEQFEKYAQRWLRNWDNYRVWGYRDAGRYVATLGTEPRMLTVPGPRGSTRDLVADALTAVTVSATHRRRGFLSTMLGASLEAAKQRGDAVSILIAAEWPIYGRFGYSPAADGVTYAYHPRRPHAALPPPPAGSVRAVEPDELGDVAPRVFEQARRLRAGQVDRPHPWWDRRLGLDGYEPLGKRATWYVHEGPDGIDGLLAWTATRGFGLVGPLGAIRVEEFAATNDAAYRDLWAYLSGIDVVDEIVLDSRPVDEPIRWLLPDARSIMPQESFDYLWLRLLDVPAALSARAYAVPGRVVLDVVDDDLGGYARGRYVLEAGDDDAKCTPTDEPAELRVSQRALASAYLGGFRLRHRTLVGEVTELVDGALDRADVMFATALAPWCQTGF
jgi:predicted acetyltransferase